MRCAVLKHTDINSLREMLRKGVEGLVVLLCQGGCYLQNIIAPIANEMHCDRSEHGQLHGALSSTIGFHCNLFPT